MSFFVTADGGLTTAGYVGCVVLMVALVVIASVLSAQKSKGIFPYVRRVSVLDGLYAGEFPAVFKGAVSDYLQLQLSAG